MRYKGSTKIQTRGLEEALAAAELDGSISGQVSNLNFDQAEPYEMLQKLLEESQRQNEHLQHQNDAQQQEILSLQKEHEKEKMEMKIALMNKYQNIVNDFASAATKERIDLQRENAEDRLKYETAIARLIKELELQSEKHMNEMDLLHEKNDLSFKNMQQMAETRIEKLDSLRKERIRIEAMMRENTKIKYKHDLYRQKHLQAETDISR
jgi:hypothetical protein